MSKHTGATWCWGLVDTETPHGSRYRLEDHDGTLIGYIYGPATTRLVTAAPDHALLAAAFAARIARWEPFSGTADPRSGELCTKGFRYATHLDEFGVPILNRNTRAILIQAMETNHIDRVDTRSQPTHPQQGESKP